MGALADYIIKLQRDPHRVSPPLGIVFIIGISRYASPLASAYFRWLRIFFFILSLYHNYVRSSALIMNSIEYSTQTLKHYIMFKSTYTSSKHRCLVLNPNGNIEFPNLLPPAIRAGIFVNCGHEIIYIAFDVILSLDKTTKFLARGWC